MKTLFLTTLAILLSTVIFAQTPQAFKYQAVIRNNQGKVLVSQIVSLRVSILQGDPLGSPIYIETHQIATNEYGIANLSIGSGTVVTGIFADIAWGTTTHFVKTELDITGNQNYEFIGTSQLLSVPYALYAEKAGNANDDMDKDPANEIQDLQLNGNILTINKNGSATQIDLTPYLDNTDNQQLQLSGNTISVTNGNSIVLPPDNDADTTNELQTLSVNNNQLIISKGNTVNIDADTANEIQALSLSNDTLYLSNGGQVYIGNYLDNTDNQNLTIAGNQLSISGGNSVTFSGTVDLDADPVNELQLLNYSNDTVYLSQSNFVVLPHNFDNDSTNEIQTLTQDSNFVTLSKNGGQISINDADCDTTNEIQNLSLSSDTLYLSKSNNVFLGKESKMSFKDFFCVNCTDTIVNQLYVEANKLVTITGEGYNNNSSNGSLIYYFLDDNNNPINLSLNYTQYVYGAPYFGFESLLFVNNIQTYTNGSSGGFKRQFTAYFLPNNNMTLKIKMISYNTTLTNVTAKTIIIQ